MLVAALSIEAAAAAAASAQQQQQQLDQPAAWLRAAALLAAGAASASAGGVAAAAGVGRRRSAQRCRARYDLLLRAMRGSGGGDGFGGVPSPLSAAPVHLPRGIDADLEALRSRLSRAAARDPALAPAAVAAAVAAAAAVAPSAAPVPGSAAATNAALSVADLESLRAAGGSAVFDVEVRGEADLDAAADDDGDESLRLLPPLALADGEPAALAAAVLNSGGSVVSAISRAAASRVPLLLASMASSLGDMSVLGEVLVSALRGNNEGGG